MIAKRLRKSPKGFPNWPLRLLADRPVELKLVDSISHETIRETLKKRKIQYWGIPPKADPQFIAAMEDVLDTDEQPYDGNSLVLCMDEPLRPVPQGVCQSTPSTKRRVDSENECWGTEVARSSWARDSLEMLDLERVLLGP